MNQQKLLRDVASLPPIAQQEVMDFIAFLKQRHIRDGLPENRFSEIENEPFIGLWKNRTDMIDSSAWVRNLRRKEWR
ncbi:MAG: DUF2281 domain-containing protein [Candidatus Thiosymbion ectosymbiont of Robbea hypermnestra]|nr:DUF2281 domain-containing protein [Candidatus Thiosymbion ectosymbiont of Robbea hypermnestra]